MFCPLLPSVPRMFRFLMPSSNRIGLHSDARNSSGAQFACREDHNLAKAFFALEGRDIVSSLVVFHHRNGHLNRSFRVIQYEYVSRSKPVIFALS